jgi:phospholipid/cholesterol/gamma-HCH transport system permease protein
MSFENFQLVRWFRRLQKATLLAGQVFIHILRGKLFYRNTLEQMSMAGPASLLITLVTGFFVGAVFTIQVAREFLQFGQGGLVGGVLSLALVRGLGRSGRVGLCR